MNKKLLISIAPLVTAAALAAMPAASEAACTAPACPHVYVNGTKTSEGTKVREIGWGTVKLKTPTLGVVECRNVLAELLENPVGGGAAGGVVQAWAPYECVDTTCTTLGGTQVVEKPAQLPWVAEIRESVAGEFRQKTGFTAPEGKNKRPNLPGYVEFKVNCEGVTEPTFWGETNPKIPDNGKSIGASPGEEEFTPGAAGETELESEAPALSDGEPEGKLKTEGYVAQELIEVKNP